MQQAQLARYVRRRMPIAGPARDIDTVERLVQQVPQVFERGQVGREGDVGVREGFETEV